MSEILPIETLVRARANELGLAPVDLVRRAGYKNVAKGLRRLDKLYVGYFEGARGLIGTLPDALDVPEATIRQAIDDSRRQIAKTAEAAWRAAFKPHVVILTEKTVPHPLFIAAIIGVAELKRVDFDPDSSPVTYVDQALEGLQKKLKRWKGSRLPCFGRPTGIIVNYSPDQAVRFDLDGAPAEILDGAYRLGNASLSIRGRPFSSDELRAVLFEDASG